MRENEKGGLIGKYLQQDWTTEENRKSRCALTILGLGGRKRK